MDTTALLELAATILRTPTAPTHEDGVALVLCDRLQQAGWDVGEDRCGNLYCRLGTSRKASAVPLVFAAHLDHPGFEYLGQNQAEFLGNAVPEMFPDAQVVLYHDDRKVRVRITGLRIEDRRQLVTLDRDPGLPAGVFGTWAVPEFQVRGPTIRAARIDDLLGVTALAAAAIDLAGTRLPAPVWFLFTRAEEIGFVGASQALPHLPAGSLMVSVECSAERPGARIGAGPVVRVGDRRTVFSPAGVEFLKTAATACATARPDFPYQRALMDGGVCEASLFLAHGLDAAGLSLPLGNYHNIGKHRRPAPEYVATADLEALVALITQAARSWRGRPCSPAPLRKTLDQVVRRAPRRWRDCRTIQERFGTVAD